MWEKAVGKEHQGICSLQAAREHLPSPFKLRRDDPPGQKRPRFPSSRFKSPYNFRCSNQTKDRRKIRKLIFLIPIWFILSHRNTTSVFCSADQPRPLAQLRAQDQAVTRWPFQTSVMLHIETTETMSANSLIRKRSASLPPQEKMGQPGARRTRPQTLRSKTASNTTSRHILVATRRPSHGCPRPAVRFPSQGGRAGLCLLRLPSFAGFPPSEESSRSCGSHSPSLLAFLRSRSVLCSATDSVQVWLTVTFMTLSP
jgi:hypothetical protein